MVVVEGYMDVVALAQHGIDYAVATLGTATTPAHVQKLFRQSDRVIFCFDGDAAGRKAAWRALENALPVLADGKNAGFLFLPDGEDPDDFVRRRGKAAFEALIDHAMPASEFLLAELSRAAPADVGRGRRRAGGRGAALPCRADRARAGGAAAPPARRSHRTAGGRIARPAGSGAPPAERGRGAAPAPRRRPSGRDAVATRRSNRASQYGQRRAPSLVRELIQALLLQPELARSNAVPQPADGTPEGAALAALVAYCMQGEHPLTTAGVIQHFAQSPHEPVLAAALATAEDTGITAEQAAMHLKAGAARYWEQAQRAGRGGAEPGRRRQRRNPNVCASWKWFGAACAERIGRDRRKVMSGWRKSAWSARRHSH